MARRRQAEKRAILPDPKYKSELIAKFINMLMLSGKKSVAERVVYGALEAVSDKTKTEAQEALEKALDNARLAGELLDAGENRGSAVKKREDTHRMAEANKAFAHYRW